MVASPMPALSRRITAEEFLWLPDTDGFELVDGELQEKAMGAHAAWVGSKLIQAIWAFPGRPSRSMVAGHEAGVTIWPENPRLLRKPDVLYYRPGRIEGPSIPEGWLSVVPDLVVEVISPREDANALHRKILDYRRAGVPTIWVIYPDSGTAEVWQGDRVGLIPPEGVLDGDAFLPGFRISLAELLDQAEVVGPAS
ncbi:MAG: Uma2 family endonuclease [Dehalococcoidia bacterium]